MLDMERLLEFVGDMCRVGVNDLLSRRRPIRVCNAKRICAMALFRYTRLSLPQIGRALGGRDHSTMIHSIRMGKRLYETDKKFRDTADAVFLWCELACGVDVNQRCNLT